MSDDQKRQLEQQLWNIANTLRGKMNADEFRDYILGFIFYKYLSEKMHRRANQLLQGEAVEEYTELTEEHPSYNAYVEAIRNDTVDNIGYFLHPHELFGELVKRGQAEDGFIIEDLGKVLTNIENSTLGADSEDKFGNLFEDLDLKSTKLGRAVEDRNALVTQVLAHLDSIDFQLQDSESDVLGDAYEYLIGKFASGAGKKAGEFYTPQQVSMILAKIVTTDRPKLGKVYDPTCGSGSLLLRVAKEAKEVGTFYGQEMNRTTYNLARMNMIMHGVRWDRFDIQQEDTLEKPQHEDIGADAIVANPPFSAKWSANALHLQDDRFSDYGRLAPKSKADFAFVQHMLHHLSPEGTMAIVLPHGVLFRGAAEGHIREFLLRERNYLDAVIGLPANIFYGTSIPTCILVFKKQRQDPDHLLFIDASQGFAKAKTQNELRPEDIDRILTTYRTRATLDKYSYLAPLTEVADNDYNLNIPRYVDTFEEEEPVDLAAVSAQLQALDQDLEQHKATITDFCAELGIKPPF